MATNINITTHLMAFAICAVLLVAAILGGNLKEKVSRWFFLLVLFSLIGTSCELIFILFLEGTSGQTIFLLSHVVGFISYVCAGMMLVTYAGYLYEFLSPNAAISKKFFYIVVCFSIAYIVLVTVAQMNQLLMPLDGSNNIQIQSTVWLAQVFPSLCILTFIAVIIKNIKCLTPREWISLLLYMAIMILCYVVEFVYPEIRISYLGGAIAIFLIYVNIQVEMRHKLIAKDAELAESRIAVMISQIQPHFLFNTLSSISEVCADNPLAQKCLITFSEYLRVNMDSLTNKTPISFEKELEHVQQYLWLEQLRFEEKLQVEYSIKETDFMLPALTLQPVVENAVRHGITKKTSAGKVRISAEKTDYGHRVVVTDDGIGFNTARPQKDERSHTGLDNTQARLSAMCGGWITVDSTPGEGTIVTINIPRAGNGDT